MSSLIPGAPVLGAGFDVNGTYSLDATAGLQRLFDINTPSGNTVQWRSVTYDLPENCGFVIATSEVPDFKAYYTRFDLSTHFSHEAKIKGRKGLFSGEVESDFKVDASLDGESYWALGEYYVLTYQLAISQPTEGNLTAAALADIKALPATFDPANPSDFFDFFERYGTHFVRAVTFGGRLVYGASIESTEVSSKAEFEIRAEAAYKGLLFSASGNSQTEWAIAGSAFTSSEQVKIQSEGGVVPGGLLADPTYKQDRSGQLASWRDSVATNPSAVKFQLMPISRILSGTKGEQIEKAASAYLGAQIRVDVSDKGSGNGWLGAEALFSNIDGIKGTDGTGACGVVVLDRKDLSIKFTKACPLASSGGVPGYPTKDFDDLVLSLSSYVSSNQYLVLVSLWGASTGYRNHPSTKLHGILRHLGSGAGLSFWDGHVSDSGGSVRISYVLAGVPGMSSGEAAEYTSYIGAEGLPRGTYPGLNAQIFLVPEAIAGNVLYTPR